MRRKGRDALENKIFGDLWEGIKEEEGTKSSPPG